MKEAETEKEKKKKKGKGKKKYPSSPPFSFLGSKLLPLYTIYVLLKLTNIGYLLRQKDIESFFAALTG